jgi:ferredoxin-thioredoxin reductase catalytic chain
VRRLDAALVCFFALPDANEEIQSGVEPPHSKIRQEAIMSRTKPSEETVRKVRRYVEKYRAKTGTTAHPDPAVSEAVITGLAANLEEVGRPLCPCNFYPAGKQAQVEQGREWNCACDEMKKWKYCHCLLFVTPQGLPVTQYLPQEHEGRTIYGLVLDPSPSSTATEN